MQTRTLAMTVAGALVAGGLAYMLYSLSSSEAKPAKSQPAKSVAKDPEPAATRIKRRLPQPKPPEQEAPEPPPEPEKPFAVIEERPDIRVEGIDNERDLAEVLEAVTETHVLYDKSDYAGAIAKAKSVLERQPKNTRMLRIVVSSSCIIGDEDTARDYYAKMYTDTDRKHVETVCAQHKVEL